MAIPAEPVKFIARADVTIRPVNRNSRIHLGAMKKPAKAEIKRPIAKTVWPIAW